MILTIIAAMPHGRIFFFATLFLVMACGDIVWWWWADRKLRPLRRATLWRTLVGAWSGWMIVYLLLACLFPQLIRKSQTPVPAPLHAAVYLWHLLVLPLIAVGGIFLTLGSTLRRLFRRSGPTVRARRRTTGLPNDCYSTGAPGRSGDHVAADFDDGRVGVALTQLNSPVRIRRMQLALRQLPAELDGMTIAHVSDMHVGKFSRPGLLPGLADQINGLRADFVVVTGDVIDMALADLPPAIEMLKGLNPGSGLFICEGNHDVIEDGDMFEQRMWESGLPFLADESRVTSFRGRDIQFLSIRWYKTDALTQAAVNRIAGQIRPAHSPS